MASSGAWMGSTVDGAELRRLHRRGFLGSKKEVSARAPGVDKVSLDPAADEVVVFSSHLARGLGLPVSPFFQQLLSFYGLQPHHLGANSITQIACFVTLCEAYQGILPCMGLFAQLFYLRAQTTDGKLRDCGCVPVNAKKSILPKIQLPDSIKKWQNTYFYVWNLTEVDRIGLPGFTNAPPATKAWRESF